jgi:DNA-binding response OmpR family regulator
VRVLVVEDEPKMADLLRRALQEQHCVVTLAHSGLDGLRLAREALFDVISLDVMLPGMDGFTVAGELRRSGVPTPILFLTARDSEADLVRGLELGGDDYLAKPFSFVELLARLRALARRKSELPSRKLQVADLVLDSARHEVTRDGRRIDLSPTEYVLLELLMRNPGRVLRRATLVGAVWGDGHAIENNTLDAFIRLLRKKIDREYPAKLLQTVRGFGYRISEAG